VSTSSLVGGVGVGGVGVGGVGVGGVGVGEVPEKPRLFEISMRMAPAESTAPTTTMIRREAEAVPTSNTMDFPGTHPASLKLEVEGVQSARTELE